MINDPETNHKQALISLVKALGFGHMPMYDDYTITTLEDGGIVIEWERFKRDTNGLTVIDYSTNNPARDQMRSTVTHTAIEKETS